MACTRSSRAVRRRQFRGPTRSADGADNIGTALLLELPVQRADKFELAINLRIARTLGLEVTPILLATADEVLEHFHN